MTLAALACLLSPAAQARKPKAQQATWKRLQQDWPQLSTRVGKGGLVTLVESLGSLPGSRALEVAAFFQAHPTQDASRAVNTAVQSIQLRSQLEQRLGPPLGQWLRAQHGEASHLAQ